MVASKPNKIIAYEAVHAINDWDDLRRRLLLAYDTRAYPENEEPLRRMLDLRAQIASLESEQQALQEALADGTLYSTDPARAAVMTARAGTIEDELMAALERWTALSA